MHLEVNQRLQEVSSQKHNKFFKEEIDLALNKAMFRFLEEGIKAEFEDTQINLSHVSALIKKNKISEAIIPGSNDPLYEDNILNVYGVLPPDHYWNINARVEVITDPTNCETAPALGTTAYAEWVAVVPFPSANASAPYFPAVTVTSSVLGTLYTAPSPISAGFSSTDSKYVIIDNIRDSLFSNANIKVYWERYRDTYYRNSFIFVSPNTAGTITIAGTGLTSSAVAMSSTSYSIYNRGGINALTNKTVVTSPTKNQELNSSYGALKANNFYKSIPREVSIIQTKDYLIGYREESFLITRFYYDYIRKPRTISLSLDQSCELSETTHPKIVDLAVEILRLDTKDKSYPQTVQDTQIRTQ